MRAATFNVQSFIRQKFRVYIFIAILACAPVSGCGGSAAPVIDANGNSLGYNRNTEGAPLTMAQLRLTVAWPQRASRAVSVSALAKSLTVTIDGGRRDGSDYVWKINRNPDGDGYSGDYISPEAVRVGTTSVRIATYAGTYGEGQVLGTADVSATIGVDGSGIPDVAIASPVKAVSIEAPLRVRVGETVTPTVTARDKDSRVVPITGDDVTLSKASDQNAAAEYLTINAATVTGTKINPATGSGVSELTATVDGVSSAPTPCEIYFSGQVSFAAPVSIVMGRGSVATFQARVSDTTEQGILWSVISADATGDAGAITPTGVYTAPTRTTDVIIRATSVYDNTKFAETRVQVKPVGINAIIN